jgi:SAM-dependent methyltransferase
MMGAMDADTKTAHARSFDASADSYERARPSYPVEAIDWLLPVVGRRVLDLGAGTGKLTRQLAAAGHDVVAVEPLPGMRAQLASLVPGADVLDGSAESIPLAAGNVDAVVVGQAWHWFDHAVAAAEIARVLRPGGVLGLLWNFADERVDWVRRLWKMMHEASGEGPFEGMRGEDEPPELGSGFESAQMRLFSHDHWIDEPTLLDLVQSRSYVIRLSEERRAQLLDAVRELVRESLTGDSFALPYRTRVWRAVRR